MHKLMKYLSIYMYIDADYYTGGFFNYRSTAALESFQNLILKYSPKRLSYTPHVYTARTLLAALDHNANCDRPAAVKKDGSLRFVLKKKKFQNDVHDTQLYTDWEVYVFTMFFRQQRYYSKKSGHWSVCHVKEEKTYPYVSDIISSCIEKRLVDPIGMNRPVVLDADDPRRISKTLASVEPPPTAQLVEEKKSRFPVEKDIKPKD